MEEANADILAQTGSHTRKSIYGLIWNATRRNQIVVVLLAFLVVPLNIAPLELQKVIIDKGILAKDLNLVVLLLGAYLVVAGLQSLSFYFLNIQEGRIQELMSRKLRHQVLRLIRLKGQGKAPNIRPGTVVTIYSLEVDPIGEFAGQSISVPVVEGGIFLAVMTYMIYSEPLLAAVALAFFVPQIILVALFQRRINEQVGKRITILRKGNEEALGLLDGREGFRFTLVAAITRAVYHLRLRIYHLKFLMKYIVLFLIYAARISVLGVGGYLVVNDQTSIGTVVAFMSGLERLIERWNELVSYFRQMSDAQLKYDLVFDALKP